MFLQGFTVECSLLANMARISTEAERTLARIVKALCQEKWGKKPQSQFARAMQSSKTWASEFLSGQKSIPVNRLDQLAAVFSVSVCDLFGGPDRTGLLTGADRQLVALPYEQKRALLMAIGMTPATSDTKVSEELARTGGVGTTEYRGESAPHGELPIHGDSTDLPESPRDTTHVQATLKAVTRTTKPPLGHDNAPSAHRGDKSRRNKRARKSG